SALDPAYERAGATAASSPTQRTTRSERRASSASNASMRFRSPRRLPVAVDDPRAIEVVRRQLDPHAIPRQDADPEAAHLARDVAEDYVVVVELHAEHRVRESLDDLALELDFLFLRHVGADGSSTHLPRDAGYCCPGGAA